MSKAQALELVRELRTIVVYLGITKNDPLRATRIREAANYIEHNEERMDDAAEALRNLMGPSRSTNETLIVGGYASIEDDG